MDVQVSRTQVSARWFRRLHRRLVKQAVAPLAMSLRGFAWYALLGGAGPEAESAARAWLTRKGSLGREAGL